MNMKAKILKVLWREVPLIDVWYYIQGHYRFRLYYSKKWKWLIRKHIKEQIDYRIKVMDEECYSNGSCKHCGCETTMLQMADKSCEGLCYLVMCTKKEWKKIKPTIYDYYKSKR